jgi:hypothetical protein
MARLPGGISRLAAIGLLGLVVGAATAGGVGLALGDRPHKGTAPGSVTAPTLPPEERGRYYHPGPPWDGKGKGPMTQAQLEAFSDYELLWLGQSFAGYNLQWVGHLRGGPGDDGAPAWDAVTFIYGTCTPYSAEEPSCPAPITIHVRPLCALTPERVGQGVRASGVEVVRGGARLLRFRDGHVILWTGNVSVEVHLIGAPERIDEAVQALRGLGPLTTVREGQPLPAPAFASCKEG